MAKVMDIGRVCYTLNGRSAGHKVVIVETHSPVQVSIVGKKIKKQKCSVRHLWPTAHMLKISKSTNQREIAQELENVK